MKKKILCPDCNKEMELIGRGAYCNNNDCVVLRGQVKDGQLITLAKELQKSGGYKAAMSNNRKLRPLYYAAFLSGMIIYYIGKYIYGMIWR